MTGNHLGEFLRARRAGLRPQDVGMARHGVRRVAGLGREEVAVLAGVNADCCSRLEQGRERDPSASAQVLDALGRALRMDPDAGAHLHPLAGTVPGDAFTRSTDRVAAEMRLLMDSFTDAPAFVVNWALDVLAANGLAEAPGTTTVIEAGHVQAGLSVLGCAYPGATSPSSRAGGRSGRSRCQSGWRSSPARGRMV